MDDIIPKLSLTDTEANKANTPNPHIPWNQLITDFQQGGLTPSQYAAFALGGIFILLLISTTILAIHAARRAHAIEAEASNAAIGLWRDTEREIVKTLPEPFRPKAREQRERRKSEGRVMDHIRRFSEDGRLKKDREREREKQSQSRGGRGRPM